MLNILFIFYSGFIKILHYIFSINKAFPSIFIYLIFKCIKLTFTQLLYTHTHLEESSAGALMHRDRSQALRKIMVWILQPLISGQSALIKCVIKWRGERTLWIIYGKCWRSVSVMKTQHHSFTIKPGIIDWSNSAFLVEIQMFTAVSM